MCKKSKFAEIRANTIEATGIDIPDFDYNAWDQVDLAIMDSEARVKEMKQRAKEIDEKYGRNWIHR